MSARADLAMAGYRIDTMIEDRIIEEQRAARDRLEFINRSIGQRFRWLTQSIREEFHRARFPRK